MDGCVSSPSNGERDPDFKSLSPEGQNDRLLAAFGYIFWVVVPLIVLFADERRSRFATVHALQGFVFGGASLIFLLLFTCLAIGLRSIEPLLACVVWLGLLLPLAVGVAIAFRVLLSGQTEFPILSQVTRSVFRRQLASLHG